VSPGPQLHHFEWLESTNTEAMRLAVGGAAHGTAVVADRQTGGRGRGGHQWYSPDNGNVYLSVIWRPDWPARRAPLITLQAAVAVARCVEQLCGRAPGLKWPNDVLLDGRKCAGILTELRTDGARVDAVVIGIGLDIAPFPDEVPAEVAEIAAAVPTDQARDAVVTLLRACLNDAFSALQSDGFSRAAWMRYEATLGRRVTVTPPGAAPFDAVAVGIGVDGLLQIERDGRREDVIAGDICFS